MKRTLLKVEEFADLYSGGTPSTSNSAYWDGGIPWITPKDLAGYKARYILSGERNISEEGLRNSSAKLLPEETVLLTTRAPIGYVAIAGAQLATNQGFKNLVCKPDVAVPEFVYYLLKNSTELLESHATGATFKEISSSRLKAIKFQLPDTTSQQRIADILSAYDDLIQNNRRRIQLLEEAARLLYKEWFVHLRFPGHEHAKIRDGVPEGWTKTAIADSCDSVNYGYTASATAEPGGPKFLRITDIVPDVINWSSVPFCSISENKKEQFLLKEGDVVVARTGATTGYAKRIGKTHPETVFASYLVRLRLKLEIDDMLVGIFMESDDYKSYIKAQVGGAAQPNANAKIISSAKILMPPSNIQRDFHEMVSPIFECKDNLQAQNEKLTEARDLLLPFLMKGEIAV